MRVVRALVVLFVAMGASADPSAAAVSERIAFASDRDGDYDIYAMDPDGSNVVQLTNAPGPDINPAISPDGTRIAYNRDSSVEIHDVWVMNADGGAPHLFTQAAEDPDRGRRTGPRSSSARSDTGSATATESSR